MESEGQTVNVEQNNEAPDNGQEGGTEQAQPEQDSPEQPGSAKDAA